MSWLDSLPAPITVSKSKRRELAQSGVYSTEGASYLFRLFTQETTVVQEYRGLSESLATASVETMTVDTRQIRDWEPMPGWVFQGAKTDGVYASAGASRSNDGGGWTLTVTTTTVESIQQIG